MKLYMMIYAIFWRFYAALNGSFVSTFQDNLLVRYSRVKNSGILLDP